MPQQEDDDPGYEVVEPSPNPSPKPPAKPVARAIPMKPMPQKLTPPVEADVDSSDDDQPTRRKKRFRSDLDQDDDDRNNERDEEPERLRPKKKKKRRLAAAREKQPTFLVENIGGLVTLVLGLLLLVIGAWGVATLKENQWNPILTIIIVLVGQLIALPVTIGMLMVIGTFLGIEYGSFASGTFNLAGMSCLVSGLGWVSDWFGLPDFITGPVLCILSIGLFMALMRLDVWETVATMVGLNILTYLINLMFLFLLAFL